MSFGGGNAAPLDQMQLMVDLDVYEGPLDVLLGLAQEQKIDLRNISILKLADQYLAFIAKVREISLEIAAEYLVMAAWLAFLKSRLLLPQPEGEGEPTGDELAARLALQLRRLDAMRQALAQLLARDRLGQQIFARGMPEGVRIIRQSKYQCALLDLLKAYSGIVNSKSGGEQRVYRLPRRQVMSVEEAIARIGAMLGQIPEWAVLQTFLPRDLVGAEAMRSAVASTFTASLEMTKQGLVELKQMQPFGPIYLRRIDPRPTSP
jgi:segregation and condensation protein A